MSLGLPGVLGLGINIGALKIRIWFWGGIFYYNYNKEPPKIVQVIIEAPILTGLALGVWSASVAGTRGVSR